MPDKCELATVSLTRHDFGLQSDSAPKRQEVTNFTLATWRPRLSEGRVMRDENGYRVMDTEWHRITCFNGLGKTVAEHCEEGMEVLVHGRIHYTKWTDATGTDCYGCEIIAEKVDFPSRPKSAENENTELVDRAGFVGGSNS